MQIAREYLGELEKRREWREAVSIAFVLEDTLKEMKLREKAGEVTVEEREMREERERGTVDGGVERGNGEE